MPTDYQRLEGYKYVIFGRCGRGSWKVVDYAISTDDKDFLLNSYYANAQGWTFQAVVQPTCFWY